MKGLRIGDFENEPIHILKNDKKRKEQEAAPCQEYQYDKIPGKGQEKAFGALFVGSTGQGKSYMIRKLLNDPNFYGKPPNGNRPGTFFDILIIISSSLEVEDEYDCFEEGSRVIKRPPSEFPAIVESIQTQQAFYHKSAKLRPFMPRICIILDDCIHLGIFGYKQGIAEWLYAVARHYLIYPFITTQYLKAISPIIRNNSKMIFIFKVFELGELEKFIDGFILKEDRIELRARVREIFDERYSFLAYLPDQIYSQRLYINLKEPALRIFAESDCLSPLE